jgi:hypothetical protein
MTTPPTAKKKSTTKKPLKKPSSHQTAPIKRVKASTKATPIVNWKEIDLPLSIQKAESNLHHFCSFPRKLSAR